MTVDTDPNILVVRHLLDLEDAASRECKIANRIFTTWDSHAKTWCEERGWFGTFNFTNGDELWFFPPQWGTSPKNTSAWFSVGWSPENGEEDTFALTTLSGVGFQTYRLRFKQDFVGQGAWKKIARDSAQRFADHGFGIDDSGELYLALQVTSEELVTAVREDTFEDMAAPLRAALELAEKAVPLFDERIAAARNANVKA
jgi:hypothetical protein